MFSALDIKDNPKRTILIYVRTIFHVTLLYVYVVYRVKAVKIQKQICIFEATRDFICIMNFSRKKSINKLDFPISLQIQEKGIIW